ncbi:thioredoxin-dependent thiol peroxidase [Alteribacillus sp. HJP-4]|uniref:thioredoxin-dependent thiol peroxidase n=1 Tax=Alteribacillus sp. HJP-4 TaxID=2775394 RepID=UPI0035CD3419
MSVKIGEKVPEFELPASTNETFRLSDFKGKKVLIYFYPKDMTPGCTTEACDFRDLNEDFAKENTVVVGVSPDPLKKHAKFIEKHQLPFVLLSDEENEAAEIFGVWQLKKNFGKEYMGIVRSTFLIDESGKLVNEWRKVRVKDHAHHALQYIREQG